MRVVVQWRAKTPVSFLLIFSQAVRVIPLSLVYMSSVYHAGGDSEARLNSVKVPRGTNSKTTASGAIENPLPKILLTNRKQNQRKGRPAAARKAKIATTGGQSVSSTLLGTTPLFPIHKQINGQIYYDYQKTLSGGVGAVPTHFYSANGLYDPDATGIGHQPVGFDQMMALYEQFTTLRAHIKVTFASAGEHARVGLYLSPDTVAPGLPRLVENGLMTMGVVSGPATANGQYAFKTLELVCDIPKYFGKTREGIIADPQMYGTIAANPGEQAYFAVCAWAGFDSSVDISVAYDVTITYESLYWEPKKLTSS